MGGDGVDFESTVSGDRVSIPVGIRHELDIEDGDTLRWHVRDDGSLSVQVRKHRIGTFSNFDGYDGDPATDSTAEHDVWGVDVE